MDTIIARALGDAHFANIAIGNACWPNQVMQEIRYVPQEQNDYNPT